MRVETIGQATLYLADCREVLPTLPRHDLILTDPPYGIGYASNPIVGKGKKASNHEAKSWDEETPPAWLFGLMQEKTILDLAYHELLAPQPPCDSPQ